MSDDFDKLRPAGDEDDNEDESLDWQEDQPKKSGEAGSGERLGFTGELNWRQDVEDAFDDQLDSINEDAFDWQQKRGTSGSAPAAGGLGFTGQLDWKKAQPDDDEGDGGEEPLDWLSNVDDDTPEAEAAAEEEAPIPAEEPYDDPLAWMEQYGGDDLVDDEGGETAEPSFFDADDDLFATPADQIDAPADGDDPLSWLNQYSAPETPAGDAPGAAQPSWLDEPEADAAEAAQPGDADLPPWLSEAAPTEKPLTEGGQLSAEWLAGADDAPESASADMSFDEWQRIQDEVTRPRDSDEEMPDLFSELGDAPPVSESDLPTTDTGQLPSWVLGMEELDEDAAPDWLTESAPETAPPSDDIFGELGLPTPETGYDFLDQPGEEEDLLAGLNLGGEGGTPDWFAEAEQSPAKETPDWLSELGDLSEAAEAPTMGVGALPEEDDFLAELRGTPRQPAAEIDPMDTSGLQDIDSLLASYEVSPNLPSTDDLIDQSAEVDRLLSSDDLEQISARRGGEGRTVAGISGLSPDAPDWLTELGANVDEVSAAAIVRKQTQRERPLDELSDRLQALHEAGLDMPTAAEAKPSEILRTLLPGVTEVLPAAPLQMTPGGLIGGLALTDAQREKAALLKTLVGTDEDERRPAGRPAAIDLTLAAPNLADLGDDEAPDLGVGRQPEPAPVSRAPRRRRRPKFDRLLIALLLTVAVALPFLVSPARIGELPAAQFAPGSAGLTAFERVDRLRAGDLALIAAEYGPTGAGELDTALDALFRHVLMRGARPVIVSGNPVGLLHARNVLGRITGDAGFLQQINQPALQANQDYYVIRYLAASAVGLRAFSEDIPRMLAVDFGGGATNLRVRSLDDFDLIAVVAESAEDIRGWAEQVAPLADGPLIAVTGQSAAPLSEPYVLPHSPERLTGLSGLLVGYRDAYTYRTMLDMRLTGGDIPPIPATETPTPTLVAPTATPTLENGAVQAEATAEAIEEAAGSPTPEGARPTNTTPPTATTAPSSTPSPTQPPTNTPTATLTPSNTPTFEPGVEVRGVIDSDQSVNVREGPGRTFAPVGSLPPGAIVQITGRNGDGTWLKVLTADGLEGWVSAGLIAVEEPAQTGFNIDLSNQMAGLISDVAFYAPAFQASPTPEGIDEADTEAAPEATPEPTLAPTTAPADAAGPTPVVAATPAATPYREERWYGMTLGLVAVILVITVGMIANILRGLLRRGK